MLLCGALGLAIFAFATFSVVLANGRTAAFLTSAFLALVLAQIGAATFLACTLPAFVLTNQGASTFFTQALDPPMWTDHGATTIFALVLVPVVQANARSATFPAVTPFTAVFALGSPSRLLTIDALFEAEAVLFETTALAALVHSFFCTRFFGRTASLFLRS